MSNFHRARLLEDIKRLHDESGSIDAVILAGGLTSRGRRDEFRRLGEELNSLLSEINALGSNPTFVAVPGYTEIDQKAVDLLWDGGRRSVVDLVSSETEFLDDDTRGHLFDAFSTYREWARDYPFGQVERPVAVPGDFALTVSGTDCHVGLVGLNTVWVRPTKRPSEGPAALHPKQLQAVCSPNPGAWVREHDFCLLITYHGPGWLTPLWRPAYRAEIAPPGRFALHLCGKPDELYGDSWRQTIPLVVPTSSSYGGREGSVEFVLGTVRVESGLQSLTLRPRCYDKPKHSFVPDPGFDPAVVEAYRHELARATRGTKPVPRPPGAAEPDSGLIVEQMELFDIRSLEQLAVGFDLESKLPGRWTCLAGINGAGKSSVLQALCLSLLGEPLIQELGGERLERLRRLNANERRLAQIGTWFREGPNRHYVEVKLRGHKQFASEDEEDLSRSMRRIWRELRDHVIVSYGATRTLSDYEDPRHLSLSPEVRRQITLFDPLAQIASAETLLGARPKDKVLHRLFAALVERVFGDTLRVVIDRGKVRFITQKERLEAVDLPDGFRSLAAWMADLCAVWCEKFPKQARNGRTEDIDALVLIDEIDLHLHPSLQRILVPRLRETLPRVQWVVTTHSPLILSSFDSAEIVALDRAEPGGIRFLDREILGFTTDEIYRWLMDTPANSGAMEDQLAQFAGNSTSLVKSDLAAMLEMSPEVTEDQAKERVRRRAERLEKFR
ncbi:AAA family ATPase [Fimbriiglobus ruber]|uniref:AAA family ATPase n=1 Tax=Fimbriiglobus ruber TaxID=1908690 RepID=UPI00137A0E52|nr:ATP-binding protein [Fimbriiglobus ruber]